MKILACPDKAPKCLGSISKTLSISFNEFVNWLIKKYTVALLFQASDHLGSFSSTLLKTFSALKVFSNVLENDPKWSEAWNKRATVYFLMSQFTNSLNDIDKVLDIEPRHFGALSGQARIFIKLQEYEKAIKSIENSLKFYPSFKSRELIPEIERLIREDSI